MKGNNARKQSVGNALMTLSVALFISSSAIRSVLMTFMSHAATVTALLLYAVLFLALLLDNIRVDHILRCIAPLVMLWVLIAWTWFMYPERHEFYRSSLYNLMDVGFPIYGAYITTVCLLPESDIVLLDGLKLAAFILAPCYAWQSLDVIMNGVWTRGSIYNGESIIVKSSYNLTWGYGVYVICVIFFCLFLLERKKRYLAFSTVGLIGIFLYGSRGPLLMFAVFLAISIVIYERGRIGRRLTIVLMCIVALLLLYQLGLLQQWLVNLASRYNLSSRTLDLLLSGSVSDSNGRDVIYLTVFQKIMEHPVVGWGIYADRYFLNLVVQGGTAYSHNVLLELWLSFGLLGIWFFIWIIVGCIRYYGKHETPQSLTLLLMCIGGSMSLLLSLSFWNQAIFWVLVAVLLRCDSQNSGRSGNGPK